MQCPLQITHASELQLTARKRQTTMQTKTSPRICVENHCKMTFHRLWSISWHSPYRGQVPRLFQIFQTSSHPANNYGNEGWSPVSRSTKRESGYTSVDCGFGPVTLSADIQLMSLSMVVVISAHLPTEHSLFHAHVPLSATEASLSQDRACGTVYRLLQDRSPPTDSLGNVWKRIYSWRRNRSILWLLITVRHKNTLTYLLTYISLTFGQFPDILWHQPKSVCKHRTWPSWFISGHALRATRVILDGRCHVVKEDDRCQMTVSQESKVAAGAEEDVEEQVEGDEEGQRSVKSGAGRACLLQWRAVAKSARLFRRRRRRCVQPTEPVEELTCVDPAARPIHLLHGDNPRLQHVTGLNHRHSTW